MKTTETYKGFEIEIWNDLDAENPFENWDGNAPLMTNYDGVKDYSEGDINHYLAYVLTDGQIIRHQKQIAEAFEIDLEDYIEAHTKNDKVEELRYAIEQSQDFDALSLICELSKTPYLNTSSRGYSQGDYADIFTCYTKEFEKVTGCDIKQVAGEGFLQSSVDLYGYWAWGDVYGFSIEDLDDSCGGFYGDDHEKSGLMEYARESVDCEIEHRKKTKEIKLKKLIKAKVPFEYRQRELA